MPELPVAYAFAAGLAASVNPCGFVMLPAFAAYRLGVAEGSRPLLPTLLQALVLGLTATAGFLAVFTAAGLVLGLGGRALVTVFPWAGLGVGVVLALLGVWLLVSGRSFGLAAAKRVTFRPRGGPLGVFLFGVGYAIASLGCTLPVFFVAVAGALSSDGLGATLVLFVSYALGMGAVLTAVAIATALSKGLLVRALRAIVPHTERIGALMLIGVGLYLVYYWLPYVRA
ncbi:MAG: cytochrome c biogenesis protein CcdA [Chloroflexota bacterium]|nr:cytochrome c biogenesis protein CcdA [Chloroflexota bacterium]